MLCVAPENHTVLRQAAPTHRSTQHQTQTLQHHGHQTGENTMNTPATRTHTDRPTVSVIVPALNEEQSIGWVMENIPTWVNEVVLVDGLSIDGTELVCTDRRDDVVIVHQRTKGKGAALRAGFAAASSDIIVMIDADGSTDPREIGRYVDALTAGADFVKGSRNLTGGGSTDFTLLRHLGNLAFVHAANLLFRTRFSDLCYGYCAFWAKDLNRLALTADGFEIEMELILSAIKANLSIVEVPSMELPRRFGESNLNAWKDGKRVLKTLITERLSKLSTRLAGHTPIHMIDTLVPAHNSEHWLPAGSDTRTHHSTDNLMHILLAHNPGDRSSTPTPRRAVDLPASELATVISF
jgi:glycosyltransferase involved in cell wall biosynthesis